MNDDEKDRALCEAHCNSAADEYFNARPQLDSGSNRRIFYAGHRKAWIERSEALEPVAVRYDFDGYGWQYIDSGSGSDWLTRHKDGEVLYALGSKT